MPAITRKKLEALVWKHTHRDFKGTSADGTRTVLHYLSNVGTCAVSLASLSDEELIAKLPLSLRIGVEIIGVEVTAADTRKD